MHLRERRAQGIRRGFGRLLHASAARAAGTRFADPARYLAIRVAPMPWELPDMELRIGSWFGTFPMTDEEGRQLGEANTIPGHLRDESILHDWRPSRIPGCRDGRPFSVAALRQVTGAWRPLLSDVAFVRARIVERFRYGSGALSPVQLLILARAFTSLPAFLHRRRAAPLSNGTLPGRFAAAYKVMAGVHMAAEDLLLQNRNGTQPWSARELLAYIESRELFVSPQGNACGGPVKMVLELLELCIEGPRLPLPESAVPQHVRVVDRFIDYAETCARLELLQLRHRAALAVALAPIEQVPSHPLFAARDADELTSLEGASSLPLALRALGFADPFAPDEEDGLPLRSELATRHPAVRQTLRRLVANQRQARAGYQPLSDEIQDALGWPSAPIASEHLFARAHRLRRAVYRAGALRPSRGPAST